MTEAVKRNPGEDRVLKALRVCANGIDVMTEATIAKYLGISSYTVKRHLDRLIEKGIVDKYQGALFIR